MENQKKLCRPASGNKLAGVCAGFAKYLDIDPTVVRVIYAFLTLFTGIIFGIILYIVLMLIIPKEEQ